MSCCTALSGQLNEKIVGILKFRWNLIKSDSVIAHTAESSILSYMPRWTHVVAYGRVCMLFINC